MKLNDDAMGVLCKCGKYGWEERSDADRRRRQMHSNAPKGPRRDQLNVYQCRREDSDMWHVGHDRKKAA